VCERIPFLILPMKQLSREPLGKTPGPSRPNHPPKRRERAVGQDAGPVSNRILRRSAASKPLGKTPGPPRTIRRSDTRASHLPSRRARLEPHAPPREPPCTPSRPPSDPSSKPLPRSCVRSGAQAAAGGHRRYRTEPLRLFAVNPLTVGDVTVPQQEETREERGEIIKRRELLFHERRSYLFIYPARPPAYPNPESCPRSMKLHQTSL